MSFAPAVDASSLAALRSAAARGETGALDEAAVHFEALFIGMLLKSARSASLGDGLLDGGNTRQYLEIMDAQVALDVARRGRFGFGRMLVEQLGGAAEPGAPSAALTPSTHSAAPDRPDVHRAEGPDVRERGAAGVQGPSAPDVHEPNPSPSGARARFVGALLPHAERVAEGLGVDPKLLVAQAALETGWGASIPRRADGRSTHNLFGMKTGSSWRGPTAGAWTLEIVGGVPERRRADFRAYDSAAESFTDYADVIARLPRYADARRSAADAEAYARAIADAGYATDPDYAEKWLAVYRSDAIAGAERRGPARAAQESLPPADNAPVTAAQAGPSAGRRIAAAHADTDGFSALTARMD